MLQQVDTARTAVAAAIDGGTPLDDVNDGIINTVDLTTEQRAALWLFAFALIPESERLTIVAETFEMFDL